MTHYALFNRGLRSLPCLEEFLNAKITRSLFFAPKQIDGTLGWGRKKYSKRARKVARVRGIPYYSLEDGFLRSVGLGSSEPPLSIVVDDLGIYYDATTESRLEQLAHRSLSPTEITRVRLIINKWQEGRISKYNYLREYTDPLPTHYVLVADQTFSDDSIGFGLATKQSFTRMLDAALNENPDSTVIIKIHPEVMSGRKCGYFDISKLYSNPRIQILADNVHPVTLIENAEAIYVVTSQIGFEGLLWRKKVHTFGMPFYAGWGLTHDDLPSPNRRKNISLENLIHAALIDYAKYIDPETGKMCPPERLIEWMSLQRHMFERFPETVYALGFSYWKKPIVKDFFQGTAVKFVKQLSQVPQNSSLAVWGQKEDKALEVNNSCNVIRIEDGFLRSIGLGADLIRPLSWVMDTRGIYYDAKTESDLEHLLQTTKFTTEILNRAKKLREKVIALKLTKYNVGQDTWQRTKDVQYVILVPGQVENDASVISSSNVIRKNIDLLRAVRRENPNGYIVYKPHPDVLAGLRKSGIDENKVIDWCDEIVTDCPMGQLLIEVDEVHVMTSLAGFEALLRGKKVVTYGQPFYSGWGLTNDHYPPTNRTRNLTLDELVAGSLLLYPTYLSRTTSKFTTPEQVVEELLAWQQNPNINFLRRKWLRPLLRIMNG